MKLLSSDYDLTLNLFDYDLRINMFFIEKFRQSGNIFLLNTGRSYQSIKREIDKFRINFDYLSCYDGNLVLNKDKKVLYITDLSKGIYNKLDSLHNKNYKFDLKSYHFDDNTLEYEIKSYDNTFSFDNDLSIICQECNLSFKKYEKYELIDFQLKKVAYYYICDKNISKSSAISLVSNLENIEKYDIFTIGDNHNDFEMIRDFNGYTFPWGTSNVKKVSCGQVLSVASLVKKIKR